MTLHYDEFVSPIGRISFASNGEEVCALDFEGFETRMRGLLERASGRWNFAAARTRCA